VRLIGLTGGIGSGKSTVSRLLAAQGALIIDADRITRQLQERGQPVWHAIAANFGWSILLADGRIDRKKLGRRVFGDPSERAVLNRLVHPAVQEEIRQQIVKARERDASVVVLDVPLLIEGGLYKIVDQVWVVYASPEQQVERVCARDGVSAETAQHRIAAQMPLKEKLGYADRVIDNQKGTEQLGEVVRGLWRSVADGG
jgi:dephospho-CoA kinase